MATPPSESLDESKRARVVQFASQIQSAVAKVVVGVEEALDQFLIALVAGGHVLLEGVPGTAKTTLAKVFARVLGLEYHRVQFTPDLLPTDITGTYIFDVKANDFSLRKGPIFCQLLLADEVNRAPAKTQAALLEAMQEHQVTIEGSTLPLPRPFLVLATQNPVEQEGVYRLPEAQLDRFLVRVPIGYPSLEAEMGILQLYGSAGTDSGMAGTLDLPPPLFTTEDVLDLQRYLNDVFSETSVLRYIVELARASRGHPDIALGASPRAALYLLQCARARALLRGRNYCTHEDVQAVVRPVLGHRLILRPEAEVEGMSVDEVIDSLLRTVQILST